MHLNRSIMMLVVTLLSVTGCARTGVVPADRPVREDAIKKTRFGDPIFAHGSEYVMSPYFVQVQEYQLKSASLDEFDGQFGSVTLFYGSYFRSVNWNNLAFYHPETGDSHLLLDRRAIITRFWHPAKPSKDDQDQQPSVLILGIAEKDTSGDGLIDHRDASAGYIADLAGRSLTRITPDATDMAGFSFDEKGERLYVKIRRDTNGDSKFDHRDQTHYIVVDLASPGIGVPLISAELDHAARRIVTE